ncbi:holin [Microbacterium phage Sucha]|nr:holin [Microbacterium phage Sucha]
MIWTKAFWKGAAERAFNTFWQTFSAVLAVVVGGELIPATGIEGVDWKVALSASAVAAILSLAKSFGNADFTAGTPTVLAVVEPADYRSPE